MIKIDPLLISNANRSDIFIIKKQKKTLLIQISSISSEKINYINLKYTKAGDFSDNR